MGIDGPYRIESGFYNKHGNKINEDAVWVLGSFYATNFTLWDFDDDGIPEILIHYAGNDAFGHGVPASLFKFIDSEYKRVAVSGWWNELSYHFPTGFGAGFCLHPNGSLVMTSTHNPGISFYHYITFDNNIAILEIIAENYHSHSGIMWENYITGEIDIPDTSNYWIGREQHHNPIIPGTDIRLTSLFPLTSMQEQITASITQRLGP